MISIEIILMFAITLLALVIIYLTIRLKSILNILKNLNDIEEDKDIPIDAEVEKKHLDILNETAKIFDTRVENVPKKASNLINKLECNQNKVLSLSEKNKEIKNGVAELIAENIEKNPFKLDGINCYYKKFDVFNDEEILKETCIYLTKNKNRVILLYFLEKQFFLIVACSADISDKGFDCSRVVQKLGEKTEGGLGGGKSFAMFKKNDSNLDFDILSLCKSFIKEEIEQMKKK
jgi:alanyl-tRNA synthetase